MKKLFLACVFLLAFAMPNFASCDPYLCAKVYHGFCYNDECIWIQVAPDFVTEANSWPETEAMFASIDHQVSAQACSLKATEPPE